MSRGRRSTAQTRTSDGTTPRCAVRSQGEALLYKSEPLRVIPGVIVDVYKARRLRGEDVYLHFYIDYLDGEERVILNSFKHLEG